YPIKSLGGIRLTAAEVGIRGLAYDRRWMLVDEQGMFLTQRKHHRMALLQVELADGGLKVFHKHRPRETHIIPGNPQTDRLIPVTIWDDTVVGQVVSDTSSWWFSEVLGISCQLVYMPAT